MSLTPSANAAGMSLLKCGHLVIDGRSACSAALYKPGTFQQEQTPNSCLPTYAARASRAWPGLPLPHPRRLPLALPALHHLDTAASDGRDRRACMAGLQAQQVRRSRPQSAEHVLLHKAARVRASHSQHG